MITDAVIPRLNGYLEKSLFGLVVDEIFLLRNLFPINKMMQSSR